MPDLWPHQKRTLEWAAARTSMRLALPMSAGKSRVVVELLKARDCRRVLVLCPLSVVGVWPRELAKWSDPQWSTWSGEVPGRGGRLKKVTTVAEKAHALTDHIHSAPDDRHLVAINYDSFYRPGMLDAILAIQWDALILDESHRIQSPTGPTSKKAAVVAEHVRSTGGLVAGLSGTPFGNDGFALWGQMRAIKPGLLPAAYGAFEHQWGQPRTKRDGSPLTTPFGKVIYDGIQPHRRDELVERCSIAMFAVTPQEVDQAIGLEDPTEQEWTCDADPVTRRAHDDLQRHGVAVLDDGTVSADNALVTMLRAAQITSGLAPLEDQDPQPLHKEMLKAPKAKLLDDLIETIPADEPIVVFGRFRHDLDVIAAVARNHKRTYGELSGRRRDALAGDATMADVQIAGVQLQSGGVGIDLTRARHAVWYALDFSLSDHMQARKRVHRAGQKRHVHLHYLAVAGTVDETISAALQRRENVVDAMVRQLAHPTTTDMREAA